MVYSEKLVKRYRELHQESLDCLLLMQVGAFMQVMDVEHCEYDRPISNPLISSSQCNKKLLFSFTKTTALECRSNSLIQCFQTGSNSAPGFPAFDIAESPSMDNTDIIPEVRS